MNNLVFGILTVAACSIGYLYSWKFQSRHDYRIAVLLLIICGLALRFFTSCDFFLHTWDERYHALVAKNLMQHPFFPTLYDSTPLPYDYKSWISNHIWLHKQPLPLWTMALSLWLFGNNELALRLPSILLSTFGIWLTFYIGNYLFNKKVGYLAAFFFSINGLIIELTGGRVTTDHIDIFFLFFIELAVFFSIIYAQKPKTIYNILAGMSVGAAVLSKWLPAFIVFTIWLCIIIDSGRFRPKQILFQFFILITTSFLVFLPWQIYIFNYFPKEALWEMNLYFRHVTDTIEGQTAPWYYYFDKIRINYGELIYLPLIWFIWKSFINYKNLKYIALLCWFIIPISFFSVAGTKMQAYILFVSPALFIITAAFWVFLSKYKDHHKYKWISYGVLFILIILPIRYSIERIKPFEKIERNPVWVKELKELGKRNYKNGILFNYPNPIEAMFYTDLIVYPQNPDQKQLTDIAKKGYPILINGENMLFNGVKVIKVNLKNENSQPFNK